MAAWLKYTTFGFFILAFLILLLTESFRQAKTLSFSPYSEEEMLDSVLKLSRALGQVDPKKSNWNRFSAWNFGSDVSYYGDDDDDNVDAGDGSDDYNDDMESPALLAPARLGAPARGSGGGGDNNKNNNNIQVSPLALNGTSEFEDFRPEKTVLAMISFGNATKQNHVQRCLRSARARGQWTGRVVIITDSPENYASLVAQDPLVYLLTPHREDWEDLPYFISIKMKFKRFKTRLIDYVMADPRLQDVEFILYLDVDIVIGKPIVPWIESKWIEGRKKREHWASTYSMAYMFDTGNGGMAAHSGVILLHTRLSKACMDTWRERIDEERLTARRDQNILRFMRLAKAKGTGCKIPRWKKKELIFPLPKDFKKMKFAQFVHITNTFHAGHTNAWVQKAYLEEALNLTPEERQDPHSLAIVPEGF